MLKNFAHKVSQNRKSSDILNVVQIKPGINVLKDSSRDTLLTEFGKATLKDQFTSRRRLSRNVCKSCKLFFSDSLHAQRLYNYMSKHWFMPSTPILSNGGTNRGLISVF